MVNDSIPSQMPLQHRARQQIIVFLGLLALCWIFFGFAFGIHGLNAGDDWYFVGNSLLDHFPGCLGTINFISPQRPLYPFPVCLTTHLLGPNLIGTFGLAAFLCAVAAFAWQGTIRELFGLSAWLGFVVGVVSLSYPDIRCSDIALCSLKAEGPAFTLIGCWLVLTFWNRPRQYWRLMLAVTLALTGLLMYENFVGVWGFGLPLALLYKSKKVNWRWTFTTVCVLATLGVYLLWRFVLWPKTVTSTTILPGAGTLPLVTNPFNIIRQAGQALGLLFRLWTEYIPSWTLLFGAADGARVLLVTTIAILIVVITTWLLVNRSRESPNGSTLKAQHVGFHLLVAGLLLIPLAAFPFLFSTMDALGAGYASFGTAYGGSLVLLALFLLLRKWRRVVVGTVVVVALATISAGQEQVAAAHWPGCDFLMRFTNRFPNLPPNLFVVVKSNAPLTDWDLSAMMGTIYYNGPTGVGSYDLGRMGYHGYFFMNVPDASMDSQGIFVDPPDRHYLDTLYAFSPLPERVPLSQSILVAYHTKNGYILGECQERSSCKNI